LWAEAVQLEKEGEPHNIPEELYSAAEEVAKHHTVHDPIAERVIRELSKLPKTDAVVTANDLYEAINITDPTRQFGQAGRSVAAGARRANWQSKLMRPPGMKFSGSVRCYVAPRKKARLTAYEFTPPADKSSAGTWEAVELEETL